MSSATIAVIDRRVEVIDGARNDQNAIRRVSDLRALPFVVLLGEPGIGKSTVLEGEAAREGGPVLKVRELMTGARASLGTTLFLDALDEYRADGQASDKVHGLASAITTVKAARWRLTCRSEDWRKSADMAPIKKIAPGANIVVVQLLPLNHGEAMSILDAVGEADPDAFLAKAVSLGAAGFVETPLSLKLLHKAVAGSKTWPSTRYDLFTSAINRLIFEWNEEHNWNDRRAPEDILSAAGEASLLLLTSGARTIWRSNRQPPSDGDARAYVTAHDLRLDRKLLSDMLDTPLFRGEGEAFEPMHRTIAEFLAAEALAKAVIGTSGNAALPLSRASALVTSVDGMPPTELRGLYAWFAAHLTRLGDESGGLRLIEGDAFTVLAYGDAAVFSTPARRAILANLGRNDPYFRTSQIGVTAVGGLAGADLEDDFAAVLTGPPDGTHRLLVVFEVLTSGPPVLSLRPLLRAIALDAGRPEWQRRRALEAHLNGADNPAGTCRELFDALAGEAISAGREALRAELAARFPAGCLGVADAKSVLADYRRTPEDNMMGRLYALQCRLEAEPLPELFDEPIESWLPETHNPQHSIEFEHLLDYALASAIARSTDLPAARLWRWTVNVRDHDSSALRDQTAKALAVWLDGDQGREIAFFDAILAEDDPAEGPSMIANKYVATTRRYPSAAVIRHLLTRAATNSTEVQRWRLFAIAVDVAHRPAAEFEAYWETYDHIAREPGCSALVEQLTTTPIEKWRQNEWVRRREAEPKAKNVRLIAPALAEMKAGGRPHHLDWSARLYFDRQRKQPTGVQLVVHLTDEATTEAILAGWEHIATKGLGRIDAAMLGKAEAEGRRYFVEVAAIAGVDRLISDDRLPELAVMPIEVAIAVLKSSFFISDQDQRRRLESWALDRLNVVPTAGAAELVDYWAAALDAGATQLSGLLRLEEYARWGSIKLALDNLLETRPAMAHEALRQAVRVGAKHLARTRVLALAEAALTNTAVTGAQRMIWDFAAFALDPAHHTERFIAEHGGGDEAVFLELSDGLVEAFGDTTGPAGLHRNATAVRLFGKMVTPEDDGGHSFTVLQAISALASAPLPEAGELLSTLVNERDLTAWRPSLRHAQAQQKRLHRDQSFKHPTVSAVRAAIAGGPPINACDLRAVVVEELRRLRSELRTNDTTPWRRYWNFDTKGKVDRPRIENECRDHLLDRLRDRLQKYNIVAAVPEARRGEETRVDVLILTGAGRNLPIEIKRHFHVDIWVAASTQLQGYTADPGADGFGIYLVFWFGNGASPTPARFDGSAGPTSAGELETMLVADLSPELRARTDVIVFDVSDPEAGNLRKPRQRRAFAQRKSGAPSPADQRRNT